MTPRIHVWTRDQILATWQSVVIVVFRVETTLSGVHAMQDAFDELARSHAAGVFGLTIVEENAPIPAPDVRAMVARFMSTRAAQIILSAVVLEGSGFRATAARGVATGLALVSRLPYRHRVFATVADAARWFAASTPVAAPWGESALLDAVARVRNPVARERELDY